MRSLSWLGATAIVGVIGGVAACSSATGGDTDIASTSQAIIVPGLCAHGAHNSGAAAGDYCDIGGNKAAGSCIHDVYAGTSSLGKQVQCTGTSWDSLCVAATTYHTNCKASVIGVSLYTTDSTARSCYTNLIAAVQAHNAACTTTTDSKGNAIPSSWGAACSTLANSLAGTTAGCNASVFTNAGVVWDAPGALPGGGCNPTCPTTGVCGADDGCGTPCNVGTCSGGSQYTCHLGSCVCTASCSGKSCGAADGCGGLCAGSCPAGQQCNNGSCTSTCTPSCSGKSCGSDGCGGTCGSCSSGQSCTSGTCQSSGGVALPAPTLAAKTMSSPLLFGMSGDTRPPSSSADNAYPSNLQTTVNYIFKGLQAQGVPIVLWGGDYGFTSSCATGGCTQHANFMTAKGFYSGDFLPALGNHECSTSMAATTGNCFGSMTSIIKSYQNVIQTPSVGAHLACPDGSTSPCPYYSASYNLPGGKTAKFIVLAPNYWDSSNVQNGWLTSTLNVATTYTFVVQHENTSDVRAPGSSTMNATLATAYSAGKLTLLMTAHTHLIQAPGGTAPYGDKYGKATPYEVVVGIGGAANSSGVLDNNGPYFGYVTGSQQSDGTILFQAYKSCTSLGSCTSSPTVDSSMTFSRNADGSATANSVY